MVCLYYCLVTTQGFKHGFNFIIFRYFSQFFLRNLNIGTNEFSIVYNLQRNTMYVCTDFCVSIIQKFEHRNKKKLVSIKHTFFCTARIIII